MNYRRDSYLLENHTFNNNEEHDHDLMDIAMDMIINPFTPSSCPSFLPPETLIHLPSPSTTTTLSANDQNNTRHHQEIVFSGDQELEEEEEELDPVKELTYMVAAMQPVDIDPLNVPKPKRRNVCVSNDPQTVIARRRRERIAEKIRILKRLVPGGEKMDIASMLDEAVHYAKFLERWIRRLQSIHPPDFGSSASATAAGDQEDVPLR